MAISIANFAFFAFDSFALSIDSFALSIPANLFTLSSVFASSIPFTYISTQ
jgi:hypothetical protein